MEPISPAPRAPAARALEELRAEPWFRGELSRREAEGLLKRDGDFLVRESAANPGAFVLTGRHGGQAKHLLLVDPEGTVSPPGAGRAGVPPGPEPGGASASRPRWAGRSGPGPRSLENPGSHQGPGREPELFFKTDVLVFLGSFPRVHSQGQGCQALGSPLPARRLQEPSRRPPLAGRRRLSSEGSPVRLPPAVTQDTRARPTAASQHFRGPD